MTMPQPAAPVQREVQPEIIFVRQQFSAFGGAELILDRILNVLGARGHNVALLARSWKNDRDHVEFIRCDPPKVTRSLRETVFARAACRTLQKYPGSLVQAHERIPCCDIFRAGDGIHAAYLEQRRRGESAAGRIGLTLSLFHRNTLKLERRMFAGERLKAVIVNSEMVAGDLVRHYDFPCERIHLVPNGIDLQRFSLAAREQHCEKVRRQLGIARDAPVALFVGSGFDRKGLARAIEAAARQPDVLHFIVIGSDRRPAAFKALAARAGLAGRFHLVGPVQNPVPYYGASDVLILPTLYDPFPSTVLEALACGLPVVTTTGCGARDLVRELEPALVCDTYDIEALAAGLKRALQLAGSPNTRDAARKIADRYDIDTMVERLLAIFNKLIPVSPKGVLA
ncbi:MAG TPA: glycosyltransferase family 4 protein [Xanthobacteraceae bacterium]|nr:glycosyltransferase family 4 protein [Xanthobacteraceae bacterium]